MKKYVSRLLSVEYHKLFWRYSLLFFNRYKEAISPSSAEVSETDLHDWERLMCVWGIDENRRAKLISHYKQHRWYAIVPGLLALWVVCDQIVSQGYPSLWATWTVFLFLLLAILIFASSAWRAWVLENKQYQSFFVWIGISRVKKNY